MENIPTVPFDAKLHVISCRENKEGRQVFVTLESLSQAEQAYEVKSAPIPIPAPSGDYITRDELALFQDAVIKTVGDNLPPPQLSAENTAVLIEAAKALAALKDENGALAARLARVETAYDKLAENFSILIAKFGSAA